MFVKPLQATNLKRYDQETLVVGVKFMFGFHEFFLQSRRLRLSYALIR